MHFVQAKSILSAKNGMNLYRGCQHGCIYCDSRSLCYQMNHPFEDIEVKENALPLLEQALKAKRKKCMIGTGAMSDPYMPLEETLRLTRGALELIHRYGFGAAIQTKSARILRDLDLLREINDRGKAVVQMTLTTYDEKRCRIVEPRVSTTAERAEALRKFREAGVPTVVWLSPLLPWLNDRESSGDSGILPGGRGEGHHQFRHGPDPPGRGPGILVRRPGPALPRPEGAVYPDLRQRLRAPQPPVPGALEAVPRNLRGIRHLAQQ